MEQTTIDALGSGEDCDKCPVIVKLVAILYNHVCSTYKVHVLFSSVPVSIIFQRKPETLT